MNLHLRTPTLSLAVFFLSVGIASAITIDMVPVGDPDNTGDTRVMNDGTTGYGSVGYTYNIGKYEVTAGQYTAFLNAVAGVDTSYGLYNTNMSDTSSGSGIARSGGGTIGNPYNYSVAADFVNRPVNYVSWGDAARFCNWLQTGTTETGAYTLGGHTDNAYLSAVPRNAGATYVIPTENEWYKAAYYKGGSTNAGYWAYATRSDTAPGRDMADASGNNANYYGTPYPIDSGKYTTVVGEFQNSAGPYGTFDQGGNVFEWNPASWPGYSLCGLRGGSFGDYSGFLLASSRGYGDPPVGEFASIGFRVASVPEPGSIILVVSGAIAGLIWRRRRK
jgi:formylglycine-generating enzyme required for sulfatase activity